MSLFSLAGKVAVVTGATGLLGRRHAEALAGAGAHVVATDLSLDRCQALVGDLEQLHDVPGLPVAADVGEPGAVASLRDQVLERFGRVDVVVNNAALDDKVEAECGPPRFEEFPLRLWEAALRVNLTGTFLCCQVLGAEMARRGAGSIVNVASTYALVAPDQSLYRRADGSQPFLKSAAYPVTKAAVVALARYLAAYWGGQGVRVNALCPGGVENGQPEDFVARYASRTPLARMARPDDYAGALIFLASDASSYMTGATLVVDGGFTAW